MTSSSGHVMASGDQTRIDHGLLRRSDGWGGNLQLGKHASRVEVALMPRQRLVEQVWGVAGVRASPGGTGGGNRQGGPGGRAGAGGRRSRGGTVEVTPQWVPVGRVRAALDDP